MFPLDELDKLYPISKLEKTDGWYTCQVSTPSHTFISILKWFSSKEILCQFTVRDDNLELLISNIVALTDNKISELSCEKSIVKIENLPTSISPFDSVVYVNSECNHFYLEEIPSLDPKTLIAFPSYSCEFSGDESPKQISCMMNDFIATVDWKRTPSPKILMRYVNHRAKGRSIGKKMRLANAETLINEIENLEQAPESFVEVKILNTSNAVFCRRAARITSSFDDLELLPSDTINFIKRFIYHEMA